VERELQEDKTKRRTTDVKNTWTARVHTADIPGAGTDANVFMVVYGQDGKKTEPITLKSSSDTFEKGAMDEFPVEIPNNLGLLSKMRVWHDNSGRAAGWKLDKIELENGKGAHR
jgi:hypothetical protein